jgi:hypothetical protein
MRRVSFCAALALASTTAIACNGKSGSPTAPTTPPATSIRAIVVSSASASSTTIQMTAKADLTDGTAQDVTASSRWEVSDANMATVSATGVLTVLHSGHVDVRATYQNMTGSLGLTLAAPQPPLSGPFALSGIAQEAPPTARPLLGATITIVQGPDTGRSTVSDKFGMFRFSSLQTGIVGVEAVKDGFLLWRLTNLMLDQDREVSVLLYPTPPTDASGASATARCNDTTWSWAPTRAEACAQNGGIAYTVCPGPLCQTTVTR